MVECDVQPSLPQGQLVCRSPSFAGGARRRGTEIRDLCNNTGAKMMSLSKTAQNQNRDRAVMARRPMVRKSAA
jgi:hypothetical protein